MQALHFLVQLIEVFASERSTVGAKFIDDAAKRPNVALSSIALIVPDFRRGIVRSSSLGVC